MTRLQDTQACIALLRQGCSDEEVERRTGFPLLAIVGLRAGLATGSSAALQRAPPPPAAAERELRRR